SLFFLSFQASIIVKLFSPFPPSFAMATENAISLSKEVKFDMDSLSPELLHMIIKHLGIKDRCNLRAFSSLEEAISKSRMECSVVDLQGMPKMALGDELFSTQHYPVFNMRFGAISDRESLEVPAGCEMELLHLRRRLFKRASVKEVSLKNIDFNRTKISFVEDLLEGCAYDRLLVNIMTSEYNESVYAFLKKQAHKELEFTMFGLFIENEALLALASMRKLVILFDFYQVKDERWVSPIWEDEIDMMLALVKKRHTILHFCLAHFRSAETIFEIFKLVADFERSQCVIFKTSFAVLNEFMQHIGYRRSVYDQEFEDLFENERIMQPVEIVHDELVNGRWSGEFELSYHEGTLAVRASKSLTSDWHLIWIFIIHNRPFDRKELGSEFPSFKETELEELNNSRNE
ncbi:hypothetical protein PFISCL1PPCAC_16483, partial [Pristionchus fissidentatus]